MNSDVYKALLDLHQLHRIYVVLIVCDCAEDKHAKVYGEYDNDIVHGDQVRHEGQIDIEELEKLEKHDY